MTRNFQCEIMRSRSLNMDHEKNCCVEIERSTDIVTYFFEFHHFGNNSGSYSLQKE